ncbi:hypothetical protein M1446_00880 [Candidatus Dependentiae bacterium]|nr:hypothetical protein [Candidatus Dependentiae bacterium]
MYKKTVLSIVLFFFLFQIFSRIEHKSSYPLIAGDTFRAFADFILDSDTTFNPLATQKGAIIFVQIDDLEKFFKEYHPKIQNPYILLTHRCAGAKDDDPIPGPYRKWVDDPKIISWFSQNIDALDNSKLKHLPIGISNHWWPQGNLETFNKALHNNQNATHRKLLCMNFSVHTYPKERAFVYNLFKDKHFCTIKPYVNLFEYLSNLQDHKFVLSPRGNGLDCHRTWEALLMGTIPIVKTSTLNPLFENLPVLVVDDWQIITESFLKTKYEEIKNKKYEMKKIFADYWFNEIKSCKQEFLKNS